MMTLLSDSLVAQSSTLIDLVQWDSPSGQEQQAVSWLIKRFHELGFTQSYVDEIGNAIGIMGNGPREIILLGHVDTVPGRIPIRVEDLTEDILLFGRGAVDAKGPLAAFIDSVARLGERPGWKIVVVGAVDEERNSKGARHLLRRSAPHYLIVGEPNRWDRIALGYKGSARVRIRIETPISHSASGAATAAETAFATWEVLKNVTATFNQGRSRLFDQLLLSLRGISSGDDGFSDWAELELGARLPLDLSPQEYMRLLEMHLTQHDLPELSSLLILPIGYPVPAYRAEKNTSLVKAALSAIRQEGGEPSFVLKTGTADLNIVAPTWQCPAIVYGAGNSTLDHTPNEHISLNEYQRSIRVLMKLLDDLTA